jgi:transposase-like protein
MTSKTTNKFSPEVRARAMRMVIEYEAEHLSRWAAVSSIAAKIKMRHPEQLYVVAWLVTLDLNLFSLRH